MLLKNWQALDRLNPVNAYHRLRSRLYGVRPDERPDPEMRAPAGGWVRPIERPASMLAPETFRLLGGTYSIAGPAAWTDAAKGQPWLFNLHCFDDLNAADARARLDWHRALLTRWVAENPPATGIGWEPHPTALRVVNWVKWALAGNTLPPACVRSLAVQGQWLRSQSEQRLSARHHFATAKALVFVGSFFRGEEVQDWRERERRVISRELSKQILPDGGYFEGSPLHHTLLLEDVLDLVNLAGAFPEGYVRVKC